MPQTIHIAVAIYEVAAGVSSLDMLNLSIKER